MSQRSITEYKPVTRTQKSGMRKCYNNNDNMKGVPRMKAWKDGKAVLCVIGQLDVLFVYDQGAASH